MRTFAIRLYKSLVKPVHNRSDSSAIGFALKAVFSLFIIGYILVKLLGDNLSFFDYLKELTWKDSIWIVLALAGMWVNLGFEAMKWLVMVRKSDADYPFQQALVSVFAGLTAGIFTPNRIGDYAGRIAFLSPDLRFKAVAWLFVDRLCQMLVTIWMGTLSFEYFWHFHQLSIANGIHVSLETLLLFRYFLWTVTILLPTGLLILPWAIQSFAFFNRYHYFRKIYLGFRELSPKILLQIVGLGFMRYLAFSLQYYFLLIAFGYEGSFLLALAMILAVFLVKSVIPSITLTELGIRESVAMTIMGVFAVSGFIAFSSTFLLYLINIILPALVGLVFINRLKI